MSLFDRIKHAHLVHRSTPVADRAVYKAIQRTPPRSIVEIGLGTGQRAVKAIALAAQLRGERIAYTAVDLFETSPAGRPALALKKAHQLLAATGAKVQLIPGDPFAALARMANSLLGTDLVIISADQAGPSLDRAWFYVPRMLHDASLVLLERPIRGKGKDESTEFEQLTKSDIVRRFAAEPRRRAA